MGACLDCVLKRTVALIKNGTSKSDKKCQPNKYANNTELTKGADSIYTWRS